MRRAAVVRAIFAVTIIACGPPAIGPVPPGATGGGPPGVTQADGSDASGSAGSAEIRVVSAANVPSCMPASDPAHPAWLDLARVGDDLVACSVDAAAGTPSRCWTVDATSGALASRATAVLPGYGYRGTTGWIAQAGSADSVIVDGDAITFAHGGAGTPHKLRESRKNALADAATVARVYAAGDTAYVLGSDGTLYVYVDGKPPQLAIHVLRSGGIGVSRGAVAVHEAALSRLTVMDGLTHRTTRGRARHDETCKPDDSYAPGNEPAEGSACGAHLAEHYRPYLATTIISDGDGFIGIDARGALFHLDDKLAETARVPLAICH